MDEKTKTGANRRDFLKMASVSAPAAVAAAAIGPKAAQAAGSELDDTRMQDTAHTRAYLDSARF